MADKKRTYGEIKERQLEDFAKSFIPSGRFGVIGLIGGPYLFMGVNIFYRQENAVACVQKLSKQEKPYFKYYAVFGGEGNKEYFEKSNKKGWN